MTHPIEWPVRTARLSLRPATAADAEATWQIRRIDGVSRWLTRGPSSFEAFREQFVEAEWLERTLVVERDGVVIGDLMLWVQDSWSQVEIADQAHEVQASLGWVLHPDWAGQGFATEAVEALLRICFDDLGLRRVTADCFAENEASWRLMERVGMRREGHSVRDSLHRSGEWLDGYAYALLADEWRATASTPDPAEGTT